MCPGSGNKNGESSRLFLVEASFSSSLVADSLSERIAIDLFAHRADKMGIILQIRAVAKKFSAKKKAEIVPTETPECLVPAT
jgi:hypothetical protein